MVNSWDHLVERVTRGQYCNTVVVISYSVCVNLFWHKDKIEKQMLLLLQEQGHIEIS